MKPQDRKKIFYIALFVLTISFALIGLVFNIKTVAKNQEIQKLKQHLTYLKKENHTLYLDILKKNSFEKIENFATDTLDMSRPKKIHYIKVPALNENT